jgi:hypothetical protein
VLARGYLSASEPVLHFGLGEVATVKRLTVEWPSGARQTFSDVATEQKLTITEPEKSTAIGTTTEPTSVRENASGIHPLFEEVSAKIGLANFPAAENSPLAASRAPLLPWRISGRGPALAVGDVDGDAVDDLVIGGGRVNRVRILHGLPGGAGFAAANPIGDEAKESEGGPILVFDADGDGRNDLLMTKGGDALPAGAAGYQPELWLNDGGGNWRRAPEGALPSLPISVGAAVTADFDHDGKLDLFLGARLEPGKYPRSARSALLLNRGGRFEDVTDSTAPALAQAGLVTSVVACDVDRDGWTDLVLAVDWGTIRYFHNDSGRGFSDWSARAGFSAAGSGWWTSLAAADFNGDGRPDFVAGNLGLNTRYHADEKHPALLFLGEFKSGGPPLPIEAYYEGDRLYPWHTRTELGALIPTILKRYPRNDTFARATLGEILGEERLARAERYAATELRSGVFLSQSDGSYRFEPLPRIVQIAPVQGLVAADLDGDGLADIYAVQNSFAPIPSIGRFDGGLSQFLRGNGRGHFEPVEPAASGLIVAGDAKALVVTDLDHDGWPDLIASRHRETMLAYRNSGVAGRRSFAVKLLGRPGNLTAIGARVTVEFADGASVVRDVESGAGGWLSQSGSGIFFGYRAENPPRAIEVRWPSGRTTRQAIVQPGTEERLIEPAS